MGLLSKEYTAWLKSLENRQEHVKSERKEQNKKEWPKSKPAKKEVKDEKP